MTARWVGVLLLPAVACGDSTGPEPCPDALPSLEGSLVTTPREVTLRHGEERTVEGTILRLSFVRVVEDSRCPIDAICIWMGNGMAEVGIAAGTGPAFPLRLNTSMEPRSADWNGVRVTLLELSPKPRASETIRAEDYTVKLRVAPDTPRGRSILSPKDRGVAWAIAVVSL